jgi:nitroreductase
MKEIFKRRSIRKYKDKKVEKEKIEKLLKAAVAAPSAGNEQPWHFVVIRDRNILNHLAEVHPYAKMLKDAPLAVAVCGDLNKQRHEGFWVQDCAAATS